MTLQWGHNGRDGYQIISITIVYSTVYSGADLRRHQSSASLAFVRGIHRTGEFPAQMASNVEKMFPFDDVIMNGSRHIIPYYVRTWLCCALFRCDLYTVFHEPPILLGNFIDIGVIVLMWRGHKFNRPLPNHYNTRQTNVRDILDWHTCVCVCIANRERMKPFIKISVPQPISFSLIFISGVVPKAGIKGKHN